MNFNDFLPAGTYTGAPQGTTLASLPANVQAMINSGQLQTSQRPTLRVKTSGGPNAQYDMQANPNDIDNLYSTNPDGTQNIYDLTGKFVRTQAAPKNNGVFGDFIGAMTTPEMLTGLALAAGGYGLAGGFGAGAAGSGTAGLASGSGGGAAALNAAGMGATGAGLTAAELGAAGTAGLGATGGNAAALTAAGMSGGAGTAATGAGLLTTGAAGAGVGAGATAAATAAGASLIPGISNSTLGMLAGAAAGAAGSGSSTQTQNKDPWGPAQPWLQRNIKDGQKLQDYYQQNPFNQQQQTGYNNLFGDIDHFRNSVAPGLIGVANGMMGSNYQRARGPVGSGGYGPAPASQAQQGLLSLAPGSNFGPVDFNAINPFRKG